MGTSPANCLANYCPKVGKRVPTPLKYKLAIACISRRKKACDPTNFRTINTSKLEPSDK